MISVREHGRLWIERLVLFVPAFLYLGWRVDPHLLYRGFGTILPEAPVFSSGWSFFRQSLDAPAGVVIYLSGFLSQGYYYSWVGALVLVLAALLLTELVRRHFACAGLRRAALLIFFPAIGVFLLASQYRNPLPAALAVSMGLLVSLVFEHLPWSQAAIRMAIYSVMAVVGYAVMGAGGVFVFMAMTVIHLVFIRHQAWWGVGIVAATIALVWGLAEYVYLLPPRAAFAVTTPFSIDMITGIGVSFKAMFVALYAYVPVAVTLMAAGKIVWNRKGTGRPHKTKAKKKDSPSPALAFGGRAVVTLLPVVVLAVGLALTYDGLKEDFVAINACARRQQWSQVLDLARALPKGRSNVACNHDINRALYHTGRLPNTMFSFPQNPHALLLTHEPQASTLTQLQLCELFIELGNINTAEKMAGELLATEGNLGTVLEKLAWINIIKSQNETAQVYLNVLRKDPIYHDVARGMLDGLRDGFAPDRAAWIDRIRSCMPTDPYGVTYGGSVEQILTGLLEQNPHNKMAFEYLMACHLLTRQLDKVIANLGRLADFDYDGIPTYYEEAILISHTMRRQPIDPAALGISPATYERYKSFLQISRSLQAAKQQGALNRLVREFGSSYFFYYGFGRVGVATLDAAGHRPVAKAE
jgi:Family of unknown function (DUF6057)